MANYPGGITDPITQGRAPRPDALVRARRAVCAPFLRVRAPRGAPAAAPHLALACRVARVGSVRATGPRRRGGSTSARRVLMFSEISTETLGRHVARRLRRNAEGDSELPQVSCGGQSRRRCSTTGEQPRRRGAPLPWMFARGAACVARLRADRARMRPHPVGARVCAGNRRVTNQPSAPCVRDARRREGRGGEAARAEPGLRRRTRTPQMNGAISRRSAERS